MKTAARISMLALMAINERSFGQQKQMSLQDAIFSYCSADEKISRAGDEALDRISERGLTEDEGLQVITAAAQKRAEIEKSRQITARLLRMLTESPKTAYLKPLLDAYENFPNDAKPVCLAIFIGLGPGDGLNAFAGKLNDQVQTDYNCNLALGKLPPHDPSVLNVLFDMLKYNGSTGSALATLLKFAEGGDLPAAVLADRLPEINRSCHRWLEKMSAIAERLRGNTNTDYRWDDDYRQVQSVTEYFPDLLGHAGPAAEGALRDALSLKDSRLSLFALRSLLAVDKDLPDDAVKLVASDDETRELLYEAFEGKGIQARFPKEFATQEALARSNLVRWLIYPTELDRAPNDIELVKVVSRDQGGNDGIVDIYLFRFRTTGKHWAAKDGWMVGTAGGYRRSEEPTIHAMGDTFSSFEKWNTKTPEKHVKDIQDLLRDWKKNAPAATRPVEK